MDENRCSGKDSSQKIGSMDAAGGSVQREVVTLLDDDGNEHDIVMKMLSMIQQSVIAESERTRSELKNQNTQIKQLAEASIDHGQAIKTLMACASKNGLGGDAMNYSNAPPKRKGPVTRSLTLKPQENPSRGYMDLEARNMQQESYDNEFMITKKGVTTKKKPGRKPKSSTGYTKAASNMKRKLDFVDEEAAATEEEVIPQDGVGSPFTYNSHNAYHTGMEMPWCLNLIWRPPGNMHFIGSELAVAAYIFANDELESEILISDEHCFVNREALLSLAPGEEVQEEFLNAVAGKLSHGPRGLRWYLPTIFAHMSLVPEEWDADTIDYLRKRYMGKVEDTTKVFIPVHRNMHWFLVVMDIPNKKMIYLDSWKNSGEQAAIMKQIKYLGYFMESVLDDRRFFRSHATPKPKCSDF